MDRKGYLMVPYFNTFAGFVFFVCMIIVGSYYSMRFQKNVTSYNFIEIKSFSWAQVKLLAVVLKYGFSVSFFTILVSTLSFSSFKSPGYLFIVLGVIYSRLIYVGARNLFNEETNRIRKMSDLERKAFIDRRIQEEMDKLEKS